MYLKLFLLILISCSKLYAQSKLKTGDDVYSMQTGFSVKVALELGNTTQKPIANCRISSNIGVGSVFIADWLYPALNLELGLYNGGMGSSSESSFIRSRWDVEITPAITFTAGTKNSLVTPWTKRLVNRNIPLYYFSDHVYPALQNPFDFSFSVGTIVVFTPFNHEKKKQRIGFFNTHYSRFQLSYYNDGGVPISNIYLGDRNDRYYTGGGIVSYHGDPGSCVDLVELSYQKFTGYTKNAFELSNILFLNFMNYHDPKQRKYNKCLWSLNAANMESGWNVKVSSYNSIPWDLQHYIHWGLYNSYHMVPYTQFWAISGGYTLSHTKMGIK